jgi:hypothetical protein
MHNDKLLDGNNIAERNFRIQRKKNLAKLRKVISDNDTNFDKKSGFVDDRIEEDIQYFTHNYSQK